jgi:hypothetical protein
MADLAEHPRTGDGERRAGQREQRLAGDGADTRSGSDDGAALIEPERARDYQDRWQSLKGDFVDEPRRAVRDANALVGEVLDDVEALFRHQRERLERDLDDAEASTEDLRLALNRYGSFFDRLLTL